MNDLHWELGGELVECCCHLDDEHLGRLWASGSRLWRELDLHRAGQPCPDWLQRRQITTLSRMRPVSLEPLPRSLRAAQPGTSNGMGRNWSPLLRWRGRFCSHATITAAMGCFHSVSDPCRIRGAAAMNPVHANVSPDLPGLAHWASSSIGRVCWRNHCLVQCLQLPDNLNGAYLPVWR